MLACGASNDEATVVETESSVDIVVTMATNLMRVVHASRLERKTIDLVAECLGELDAYLDNL